MRLFLAINLPPHTRRDIVEAIAPLKETGVDVRWTAESKLHLTMKFLGEQEPSRMAGTVQAVEDGSVTAPPHVTVVVVPRRPTSTATSLSLARCVAVPP